MTITDRVDRINVRKNRVKDAKVMRGKEINRVIKQKEIKGKTLKIEIDQQMIQQIKTILN